MYPKNAASPERIAIGPIVQISDGAVQTSGVSVKVLPIGTTASAGGGTIAYEEGIVHYLPTQAETNHTSFVLIAYKTGCIPASGDRGDDSIGHGRHGPAGAGDAHLGRGSRPISTLTGHTPQTGDTFALANGAAGFAAIDAVVDAILVDTAEIGAAGAGLTALASAANLLTVAGYLDTEIAAILADTNELQTDWADGGRLDLDSRRAGKPVQRDHDRRDRRRHPGGHGRHAAEARHACRRIHFC